MKTSDDNPVIQDYIDYLKQKDFSEKSIPGYACGLKRYLNKFPRAKNAGHADILNYLKELRDPAASAKFRNGNLKFIKKYYDYLLETRQRNDHPCRTIYLRGLLPKVVLQSDLLTQKEFKVLLKAKSDTLPLLELRNQVMLSFLIYQGLMPGEVLNIKLKDLNWTRKTVFASCGRVLHPRRLPLHPSQAEIIKKYLLGPRKSLEGKLKSEYLIINYCGKRNTETSTIGYMLKKLEYLVPGKKLSPKIIRYSVIFHWLNRKKIPIDQVQLLSGFKWISSAEKLVQVSVKDDIKAMNKWFPI